MKLRITNHTRNSLLATHATAATTPEARRQGLIGYQSAEFQPGAGLLFVACNAVHTVQMTFEIDILFVDMLKMRIQKTVSRAAPTCHFNVRIPVEVCSVIELPAGVIELTGTQPGDVLVIMAATHCSEEEQRGISSLWPQSA